MKSLNLALSDYFKGLTVSKKTRLVWTGTHFTTSWFMSDRLINEIGWEIIM